MTKLILSIAIASGFMGVAQAATLGTIDHASLRSVRGWACDTVNSTSIGYIQIEREDGPIIGTVDVDLPSEPAVNNICTGGTNHRFNSSFNVDSSLIDNENYLVHYYFVVGSTKVELPDSPKLIGFCNASLGPSGLCY